MIFLSHQKAKAKQTMEVEENGEDVIKNDEDDKKVSFILQSW